MGRSNLLEFLPTKPKKPPRPIKKKCPIHGCTMSKHGPGGGHHLWCPLCRSEERFLDYLAAKDANEGQA